jgi:hypothetical protein
MHCLSPRSCQLAEDESDREELDYNRPPESYNSKENSPRAVDLFEDTEGSQKEEASWWRKLVPKNRMTKNMLWGGFVGLVFVPLPGAMATGIAIGHQVLLPDSL